MPDGFEHACPPGWSASFRKWTGVRRRLMNESAQHDGQRAMGRLERFDGNPRYGDDRLSWLARADEAPFWRRPTASSGPSVLTSLKRAGGSPSVNASSCRGRDGRRIKSICVCKHEKDVELFGLSLISKTRVGSTARIWDCRWTARSNHWRSIAFRLGAKTAHPDVGGSDEHDRRIAEARDVLLEQFVATV